MIKVSWLLGFLASISIAAGAQALDRSTWIGSWGMSPAGLQTVAKLGAYTLPPPTLVKGTIRYRLRLSLGGSQIRLRFSNDYGDGPLVLSAASVGLAGDGFDARPKSLQRVKFGGKESITIPAHAAAMTDPLELSAKPLADLLVSVYLPEGVRMSLLSPSFDAILLDDTNATSVEHLLAGRHLSVRPLVSEVDVLADRARKLVVTLGDSITDGNVGVTTAERGWPGILSRRLQPLKIAVVNAGIGGNRLLKSMPMFGAAAPERLDRDVLAIPGLSYIIVLEGINDIGMSGRGGMFGDTPLVDPQELIAADAKIIERAHERGVKVFGATMLPFEGAQYYSAAKEQVRETVNEWIRTSKAFDAVIDFDQVVRDPAASHKLGAQYDSGDHLHPNSEGDRKIADSIDLRLFK